MRISMPHIGTMGNEDNLEDGVCLQVFRRRCKNCLFGPNKIVNDKRKEQILKTARQEETHFICHEASVKGKNICCRGYYDLIGNDVLEIRLAHMLNIVKFVE